MELVHSESLWLPVENQLFSHTTFTKVQPCVLLFQYPLFHPQLFYHVLNCSLDQNRGPCSPIYINEDRNFTNRFMSWSLRKLCSRVDRAAIQRELDSWGGSQVMLSGTSFIWCPYHLQQSLKQSLNHQAPMLHWLFQLLARSLCRRDHLNEAFSHIFNIYISFFQIQHQCCCRSR